MSEKIFTADEFALLDVNHLEIHKFTLTIDGKVAIRVVGGTSSGGGGDMYKVENLSGLANYAVARSNLSVYSITQIDTLFSGYYTETEVDTLLGGKANTSHTHTTTDITNLSSYTGFDSRYYTETETNTLLSGKSDTSHNHSGVYEPAFSKNTAFNKNFGTTTGTVLEGNANLGLVGTKEVDEVAIGNGKILSYNSTSGKLEYIVLGGGGDMLASIYDPAGGARQVAFANQLFSGAYADLSGKPTLGTMSAENTTSYYNKTELDNLFNLKLNKALTQLDSVNLNTIIDNGFYCANSNCTNLPETSIKTRLRVNKDPSNSDLAMQEALTTTTLVSYVRTTANGGTTWTSWTRIKATDETKANTSHTHTTTDITNLSSYTGLDSRYYTETETDTLLSGKANTSHTHTTTDITNLSSYTGLDSRYYTETETNSLLAGKQATLVSGTNIKTINGTTLLGSGNLVISSGGSNPIFETFIAGEQATGLIGRYVAKGTQTLTGVKISLSTLPTGASFKVDVRKNGTASANSIFTSDTPVEILTSASATNGIYISTSSTIDNGSLVENDVLYFYITQIGSTLSGNNLEVVAY